ncbi:hypothetical protein PLESTB_000999700 [Pleodorina starrii]|uniref:Uncharacterized protein n=1 Tax=Pleodorina starrii TaxID=330485 RepID=A0A9W6BPS9_9CHLO|nr:hypothetical protein PLESTM_001858700 [Pleodorina starrii]GLC55552.1 hypothetical protein PLESTB_000999700 [Pleodorina starrii]
MRTESFIQAHVVRTAPQWNGMHRMNAGCEDVRASLETGLPCGPTCCAEVQGTDAEPGFRNRARASSWPNFRPCWELIHVLLRWLIKSIAAALAGVAVPSVARSAKQTCADSALHRAWNSLEARALSSSGLPGLLRTEHPFPATAFKLQTRGDVVQPSFEQHQTQPQHVLPHAPHRVLGQQPRLEQQRPSRPTSLLHASAPWLAALLPRHRPPPLGISGGSPFEEPPPSSDAQSRCWRLGQRQAPYSPQSGVSIPPQRQQQQQQQPRPTTARGAQYAAASARYTPAARLRCVQLKISGREPEDLPADFAERLRGLASARGCHLASVCVRRGCVELTLDVENADPAPHDPRPAAAAEADPLDEDPASDPAAAVSGGGRPAGGGLLDLTTPDGAVALAQRVHASVASVAGGGGGGESSMGPSGGAAALAAHAQAAPLPAAAVWRAVGPATERAVGGLATPPHSASAARTIAVGQSAFVAPPKGPAITHVHPRVVTVKGRWRPAASPAHAILTEPAVGGGQGGAREGTAAAAPCERDAVIRPSAEALGAGAAAAAATAAAAAERLQDAGGAIRLYVELSVPLSSSPYEITPPQSQPRASVGGSVDGDGSAAVTAAMADPVARVPPGDASVELLVRCSGRYIAVHIQPAAPLRPASDAASPDAASTAGGDGCGPAAAAAAEPAVTLSYLITLLEPPPPGAGVMLVDLRWCGRPAQVVPVVLLDEQDEQLRSALFGVATAWTGPPDELDGLLYDFGAWTRCMAARRAASRATRAATAAAGAAAADMGVLRELLEAAAAAAAAAAGSGGMACAEPPYLPILGASLLQFAHAQGLVAMSARLQMDMRVCGYTAPFRPLLRGRMPPSPPSQRQLQPPAVQLRPTGHRAAAAAVPPPPPPAAARDSAAAAPATSPAPASAGPSSESSHVSAPPGSAAMAAPVPPGPPWSAAAGGMAMISREGAGGGAGMAAPGGLGDGCCPVALSTSSAEASAAPLDVPGARAELPPPATAAAAAAAHQMCGASGWLPWARRLCRRYATAAANEKSYQAFVESQGAAVSCLFHLLGLLGLMELLVHLILWVHQERPIAVAAAAAAVPWRLPPLPLALLLGLVLASLPSAVAAVWLLLPAAAWRRVAPAARVARHACLAAGRLVPLCLSLSGSRLLPPACRLRQVWNLGPGALVMEGVVMPAACPLSPAAALLLAALKLPLYVAAGRAAAAAAAAAGATASHSAATGDGNDAVLDAWGHRGGGSGGGAAALAEAVFRALAVTAMALATTLVYHASLRARFQQKQQQLEAPRKADGPPAEGKATKGVAAGS